MPFTFERDDGRRRIVVTGRGVLTGADLRAIIRRQVTEDAWAYAVLYDATDVTGDPSSTDLRAARDLVQTLTREKGPRGPVAMVAPSEAIFGMGRLYEALADGVMRYRAFRTRADADAWLEAHTTRSM